MIGKAFYILTLLSVALAEYPLYITLDESTDGIADCTGPFVLSCQKIDVDIDLLGSGENVFIPACNSTLSQKGGPQKENGTVSYEYNDELSENHGTFLITINENSLTADIHCGHIEYEIASCGLNCHVLVEEDLDDFPEEQPEIMRLEIPEPELTDEDRALIKKGENDRQSLTDVSIKVYYTPEVGQAITSVPNLVNLAIRETNTGYANSGVLINLVLLGNPEMSSVSDNDVSSYNALLYRFRDSKGSVCNLRGGADITMLLTERPEYCGIAFFNVIGSKRTVGVTSRSCATGYYSFGHEIAHMYGAHHNREVVGGGATSSNYNFGVLINNNGNPSGYRTIMSYNANGYSRRINYYSNTLNFGSFNLGDANNNNARVLNDNRFRMAAVDDECPAGC